MAEPQTQITQDQIADEIIGTGLFKPKTEYILIGDEPRGGSGVVDLRTLLKSEDFDSLKKFLSFMPRQMLRDWFLKKVWPSLPDEFLQIGAAAGGLYYDPTYGDYRQKKRFEDLVWAAFIDVFNEANLEQINKMQMGPWTWEEKKLESYYLSQNQEAVDEIVGEISAAADILLDQDPKAREIMQAYLTLTPLGDKGLEINRQNAVKELLKQKEYVLAQAIVDAYRFVEDTEIGPAISQPVPYDIVTDSGVTIAKATE